MYSVIFATLLLDYTQLSLASYFIIGVLHRSGDSYLGESKPPDKPVLFLGTVESWTNEGAWLAKIDASPEKADLSGRQVSPIPGSALETDIVFRTARNLLEEYCTS